MLNAWISSEVLDSAISPVTALVDEAKIRFDTEGLRIQTVDAANVGAISIDLLADGFHSYESDGLKVTIDVARFKEIMTKASGHGNFMLSLDEERRTLMIKTGEYEFEQSLLLPETAREGMDPHEFDCPGEVVLDGADFAEAVDIASMFSEQIKFEIDVNEEVFIMTAKGDQESMHVTLERDHMVKFTPAKAYGNYSVNYLNDIRKTFPKNTEIKIGLGEEMPLKLQYEIANGNGRVIFGLAPRV